MTPPLSDPLKPRTESSWEQEQLFHELAEVLPQLMWTSRPDGYIDYVNGNWLRFAGLQLEQATGEGWAAAVHPDDRERVQALWARSIETSERYEVTFRLRHAEDDGYRWFISRASPIRNAQGHIVKWLGTTSDIDAQRHATEVQQFLASASEELASSLDYELTLRQLARLAVPRLADWCAVDLLEPDDTVRRVVVTHTDPSKEALAMELLERYPPNPDDPNDGLYKVIRSGQTQRMADIPPEVIELGARDLEHLEILRALQLRSYVTVPLKARGRIMGVFTVIYAESNRRYSADDQAVIEDLARRAALAIDNARLFRDLQRSADEVHSLNEELEARVRERTAELADVNRELESFCMSVSHDLRAPLRHITGFAQMLEKRARSRLDEQSRSYVITISSAAEQGARLVDDLLEFSRLGRSALAKTPVDLAALLPALQRELVTESEDRRVTWKVGPLPVVQADATLLQLALRNLLSNALKFTRPRPEAIIEITARDRTHEGVPEVEICIRDNGVGFEPEFTHKLFGVFQRLHVVEDFEGTGIGLANVRRIIARHGGRTWAEGAVEGGAAFFFTLPRTAQEPHA